MTSIEAVMTETVETLPVDATVETARALVHELGLHAVVVVDGSGELAGIVTSLDLAADVEPGLAIENLASGDVHTVHPSTEVSMAALMMRRQQIHHLVVTDGDRIAGVVSSWDLLEGLASIVRAHTLDEVAVAPVAPGDEMVVERPGRVPEWCRIADVQGPGGLPPYVVEWEDDPARAPSTIRVIRHSEVALDGCER